MGEFSQAAKNGIGNNLEDIKELLNIANIERQKEKENLGAYNRIVFGAPGTGKSYTLHEESKVFENNFERVTFHPNYSYAQFVGTYKPVKSEEGDSILYEYVPGPFMRVYVNSLKSDSPQLLLIEEINRANVAAVFGDIFQLLDRDNGCSIYSIQTSEDIRNYLAKELFGKKTYKECSEEEMGKCKIMRIPDNMYIWATMNSADQGVFPMDTAFKRRWEFEYIGINASQDKAAKYIIPLGMGKSRKYVNWDSFRTSINDILIEECHVHEDKLLGPFFISENMLKDSCKDLKNEDNFVKAFESKVIMYLFEDVMKMRPQQIFKGYANKYGKMIYSEICNTFEKEGESIFGIELETVSKTDKE